MKNSKKGFTLVELIIVVAVIALLAAVLIPTFSSLITKANQAKDEALVSNFNKAIALSTEKYDTVYDVLGAVKENAGFDVAKISASVSEHEILWDSVNYCFVYKTTGGVKYIPETQSTTIADNEQYKFWQICDEKHPIPETQTYSIYWAGADLAEVNVSVGFDAGDASVGTINYVNNSNNEKKVVLNAKGTQTINVDAEKDTIKQFGEVQDVNIAKCAPDSYEIYGKVSGTVTVKQGHVKVEEKATVGTVVVPADATGAVKLTNNGTLSVVNTISAPTSANISVTNNGAIDVSVGTTQIEGTQSTTKYETVKKLTSDTHEITEGGFYDGTGVTIGSTGNTGNEQYALNLKTTDKVVVTGVTLTGNRGIQLEYNGSGNFDFTLVNSIIQTSVRGIQLWFNSGDNNTGARIVVNNCKIENSTIQDYDTNVVNQNPGIGITGAKNATVVVRDTTIQGYGYAVQLNYYGTSEKNENVDIQVENCILKGRAGFDAVQATGCNITIKKSLVRGINIFGGKTESFGVFVLEQYATNCKLTVEDCELQGYRSPATDYNTEYAFEVRGEGNTINMVGETTMYEEIYFTAESTNVPSSVAELMNWKKISAGNTINGTFKSATCVIHKGSETKVFDWLKK